MSLLVSKKSLSNLADFKAFFPAMLIVYRSLVLVKILKTTMEGSIKAIPYMTLKWKRANDTETTKEWK